MRKLLIRLLFRMLDLDISYREISDKQIEHWLYINYTSQGFREYFRKRDLQLLKTIGLGVSQQQYDIYLGQRLELMHLLNEVTKVYKIRSRVDLMNANKNKDKSTDAKGGETT